MQKLKFPKNKKFAFTIIDDTDFATVNNIKPIYELLFQLNILTTKTVWVFSSKDVINQYCCSHTLSNPEYLEFIRWLNNTGFEIAFHGASMSSSIREQIQLALEQFKEYLGFYPNIHINNSMNRENL